MLKYDEDARTVVEVHPYFCTGCYQCVTACAHYATFMAPKDISHFLGAL